MPAPLPTCQSVPGPRRNIQRTFAKWPLFASLAAAFSLLGPSCVPDASYPHDGHHRPAPPSASSANSAYNTGHADGRRDRQNGRRYDPQRGQRNFPPPLRDSYVKGYRAGYDPQGSSAGWTQRKAYDQGYDHGRRDKIAGKPRQAGRHLQNVPRNFQRDFTRGYNEGWDRTSTGRPPGPILGPIQRPRALR